MKTLKNKVILLCNNYNRIFDEELFNEFSKKFYFRSCNIVSLSDMIFLKMDFKS